MKIGIFSKFEVAGGSEFRCVEMANAIKKYSNHSVEIISQGSFSDKVAEKLDKDIKVHANVFSGPVKNIKAFYEVDSLLTVNTDSKDYTTRDFWEGKSTIHSRKIEISNIKQMNFLFNFIISPSQFLSELEPLCQDIRIITTNRKFFDEISQQDRYNTVRHFPRLQLESPINPASVDPTKTESPLLRIGMHSKGLDSKWNEDFPKLIESVHKKYPKHVFWDFMGMNQKVAKNLSKLKHVKLRPEFSMPVKDYLRNIDIFCFFPSWNREEPWARSVAEALMSGCPVLATDKGGNKDQIIHGNNGYLCKSTDDYFRKITFLQEHKNILKKMGKNSSMYARNFTSEKVIGRFLEFIKG